MDRQISRVLLAALLVINLIFIRVQKISATTLFTHYSGISCDDASSESLQVPSRMACQTVCMDHAGCLAYTFDEVVMTCGLKQSCASKSAQPDSFSGERMTLDTQRAIELAALLEFKSSVEESMAGCHIETWNPKQDRCSWQGITCNGQNLTTSITMKGCNLKGELPIMLEKLESLTYLNLAENSFHGPIPYRWRGMRRLQVLFLEGNAINGSLPGLLRLPQLKHLDLSENQLEGTLPRVWADSMTSLEVMDLADNQITGPLPESWVVKIRSLRTLNLEQNAIQGTLPAVWGSHRGCLKHLFLNENALSGPLPSEWAKLKCLTYLDLSLNNLTGTLPPSWGRMMEMREMYLCENSFRGLIPASWYKLPEITDLCLDSHAYQPALDIAMQERQRLWVFHFQRSFDWTCSISDWKLEPNSPADVHCLWPGIACDPLRRVIAIKLPDCKIAGRIPTEFTAMTSLLELDLSRNQLTGTVPKEYSQMVDQLATLSFSSNRLEGQLPAEYSVMEGLQTLDLSKNSIDGSLPAAYASLKSIQTLNLCCNHLIGLLPDTWGQLSMPIQSLFLCSNSLEGHLPSSWTAMPNLAVVNFARNSLVGDLNADWASMRTLASINLTTNQFEGRVPEAWGALDRLQYAGLCDNKLDTPDASRWSLIWPSAEICVRDQGFSINFPGQSNVRCSMPEELIPKSLDLSRRQYRPPGSCTDGQGIVVLKETWHKLEDGVTCLCVDEDFEMCDDGMLLGDDEEEDKESDNELSDDAFSNEGSGGLHTNSTGGRDIGSYMHPNLGQGQDLEDTGPVSADPAVNAEPNSLFLELEKTLEGITGLGEGDLDSIAHEGNTDAPIIDARSANADREEAIVSLDSAGLGPEDATQNVHSPHADIDDGNSEEEEIDLGMADIREAEEITWLNDGQGNVAGNVSDELANDEKEQDEEVDLNPSDESSGNAGYKAVLNTHSRDNFSLQTMSIILVSYLLVQWLLL